MTAPRDKEVEKPEELWSRLLDQTRLARDLGTLRSFETEYEIVWDDGLPFMVRIVSQLARKDAEEKKARDPFELTRTRPNPFLPYDKDMEVCVLTDTHACLLNKFNVVEHHSLVVTRRYEDQLSSLTPEDFEATWICLSGYRPSGLAFYNGGTNSGASQRHKHLQVVPLPIIPSRSDIPPVPLETAYRAQRDLGFPYEFKDLTSVLNGIDADRIPRSLHTLYRDMLSSLSLDSGVDACSEESAYNLLFTKEWMLMVPRRAEKFNGMSFNALAFAGALLVRNQQEMDALKRAGPLLALQNVAYSTTAQSIT